jgi:release factor glutamine methyltransferase
MEIGHGQSEALAGLLHDWASTEFINDLQGIPRVAISRKAWPPNFRPNGMSS